MEISQVQPTVNKTWVEQFISVVDRTDVSPPLKGEGSLPKGSSFPPSVRGYIPHLAGSKVAQRTTPFEYGTIIQITSSPFKREKRW